MAKKRELTAAQKQRAAEQKSARAAGVKTLSIQIPDICRAAPGSWGEGAYIEIKVVYPRLTGNWGRGEFLQYYIVGRGGRLEYVEDMKKFKKYRDNFEEQGIIENINNFPDEESKEAFYLSMYRSREEAEEQMQKIVEMISVPVKPAAPEPAAQQAAPAAAQTQQAQG